MRYDMHEHGGVICKTGALRIITKFVQAKKTLRGPNLDQRPNCAEGGVWAALTSGLADRNWSWAREEATVGP